MERKDGYQEAMLPFFNLCISVLLLEKAIYEYSIYKKINTAIL